MRRLPDPDFARISPLATEAKRRELLAMASGFAPFSYGPARRSLPDLLNASIGFVPGVATSWELIKSQIIKLAKSELERDANLQVAQLLHDFFANTEFRAISHDFGRFNIGGGHSLAYWSNAYFLRSDTVSIAEFDFRRSGGLTPLGWKFAASVAHEHIRSRGEDFSDAQIMQVQLPQPKGGERYVRLRSFDESAGFYSYDQIIEMAAETQRIWQEVQDGRRDETRRTGTDGSEWWGG